MGLQGDGAWTEHTAGVTTMASTSGCCIFRHVHWALKDKQGAGPTKVKSKGMKTYERKACFYENGVWDGL